MVRSEIYSRPSFLIPVDAIMELSNTVDYCAFQVGNMIHRSKGLVAPLKSSYSPAEIAAALNELPNGNHKDLFLNDIALHHGWRLFSKFIGYRGFELTKTYSWSDRLPGCFEIPENKTYGYYISLPAGRTEDNVSLQSHQNTLDAILILRNQILHHYKYAHSTFDRALHVYLELYEIKMPKVITPEVIPVPEVKVKIKRKRTRKSTENITEETMKHNARSILSYIEENYGDTAQYVTEMARIMIKRSKRIKNNDAPINENTDNNDMNENTVNNGNNDINENNDDS